MSKENDKNAHDERSFEDRVFARFDALDARTRSLEKAAKPKTVEKIKTWAEILQSVALACGVLIGGGWALYKFLALRASYKAEAEIRQAETQIRQAEAQIRQLELANDVQGVVNIAVNAKQVPIPNDPERYIKIDIQVQNAGNRNLVLEFPEHALAITKVKLNEEGQLQRQRGRYKFPTIPSLSLPNSDSHESESNALVEPMKKELVRAGQTIDYPSWVHVEEAGVYLVTFVGILKGEDQSITQQALGVLRPIRVGEHTFIVVN